MIDYVACLTTLYPKAKWTLNGDTYDGLDWLDDSPKPTLAELEEAWPTVRDALAWGAVRTERDRLLVASDWTQVADAPVDTAAWAAYRQALRDIPQTYAAPDEVVWPETPQ